MRPIVYAFDGIFKNIFCVTRDGIQGLSHTRQAAVPLSYIAQPCFYWNSLSGPDRTCELRGIFLCAYKAMVHTFYPSTQRRTARATERNPVLKKIKTKNGGGLSVC